VVTLVISLVVILLFKKEIRERISKLNNAEFPGVKFGFGSLEAIVATAAVLADASYKDEKNQVAKLENGKERDDKTKELEDKVLNLQKRLLGAIEIVAPQAMGPLLANEVFRGSDKASRLEERTRLKAILGGVIQEHISQTGSKLYQFSNGTQLDLRDAEKLYQKCLQMGGPLVESYGPRQLRLMIMDLAHDYAPVSNERTSPIM
jgi:hypothetical protein